MASRLHVGPADEQPISAWGNDDNALKLDPRLGPARGMIRCGLEMNEKDRPDMQESPQKPTHCATSDFAFFYAGLEADQLLIQKCSACGALRNPPGPMCPVCSSLEWTTVAAKGSGAVYSYTVHYHPPLAGFETPHPVVLVALDEGVRFIGSLRGVPINAIRIGMPVRVEFAVRDGLSTFNFRPA